MANKHMKDAQFGPEVNIRISMRNHLELLACHKSRGLGQA